ncbi:hypothetical protein KVR01_007223 [Diaporthe batatas]|uniref:uncharacterized protein n=1 Tax=Diaporthe batatas TaxID=748121 RepID=UPI001D05B2A0|nr:uncharacterized protein KVR01_007223 [Diaporthe batatas]KAG8162745.1 hypothetical protein KVR01_007223 [Diaporthe batatas]
MAGTAEPEPNNGQSKLAVMAPYRYELVPLPTSEHTRVLVLQPGPNDDERCPLSGSLKLLDIADADSEPFKFEAISYVWGRPKKSRVIIIDGQLLRITRSLRRALLQTRLPDRPRRLWADGICINQSDDTEKGHQVAAMGRIYTASQRTLICLGMKGQEHAQQAAGLVDEVNLMIQNVRKDPNFLSKPGSFPFPTKNDTIVVDSHRRLGWNVMLDHPWFRRGWVLQEASLGHDACVLWASVRMKWTDILRVDYWFSRRGYRAIQSQNGESPLLLPSHHSNSFARRRPEEATLFDKDITFADSVSTLEMLFEERWLELSDPRDRIYAFMALDNSDRVFADLQLEPDYKRPFQEIYHDFAVKYIEKTGDLDILSYIRHNKESLASPTMPVAEAIPSWVPRWDLDPKITYPLTTDMGEHPKIFTFTENNSNLRVRGLILGSVEYSTTQEPYCEYDQRSLALQNVISLWKEVVAASSMNGGPYDGRQAFAFFDVLCPYHYVGTFEEWSTWRQAFAQLLQSYIPGPEPDSAIPVSKRSEPGTEKPSLKTLAEHIWMRGRRRFVLLSRGYYGLAPPITQEGDRFALIYGCGTLSILRPVGGKPGYYKVVGPVYVESKTVIWPNESNMMGEEGCRDWEEWDLTEEEINLC